MIAVLWIYLAAISAGAIWVCGYMAGHAACERREHAEREDAWAAYLARKRELQQPLAGGQRRCAQ